MSTIPPLIPRTTSSQQASISSHGNSPTINSPNSMIFSAFLEKDFDVKSWVNSALSNARAKSTSSVLSKKPRSSVARASPEEEGETSETLSPSQLSLLSNHTAILVEKLDFLNQEVFQRLERAIDDVIKSMPRVISDLEVLKEDTESLKYSLTDIQQHLDNVEANTGAALERLRYLDLVKTRMESSRDVLREAENWSNLEAEASTIFASQDYQKASSRLHEAEKSLAIFQNTTEFEERRRLLTELQNQLEATISPQVFAALNQHDVAACQKFFTIFSQIGRKKAFCNYYYGSRKAPLVKLWQSSLFIEEKQKHQVSSLETPTSIGEEIQLPKFVNFLQRFYDECFVVLNEEHTWCGNVFPDANETLISLIENIFNSLKPSLGARLELLVDHYNERCLPEIIRAFIATENFAKQIERTLSRIKVPDTNQSTHETNPPSLVIPKRSSLHIPTENWGIVIFEPFSKYQNQYATYEKTYLNAMLQINLSTFSKSGTIDLARIISDTITKTFILADESLSRCGALTYGFGSVGLQESLNTFFINLVQEYRELLDRLSVECGLNTQTDYRGTRSSVGSGLGASSTVSLAKSSIVAQDDFDFDNDKFAHEDWSNFQIGLRLLDSSRVFSEKLELFECKASKDFLKTLELLEDYRNVKEELFDEQRSSSITQNPYSSLPGTYATLSLLQQSPLNSYQLRELLSSLEQGRVEDIQGDEDTTDNTKLAESTYQRQREPSSIPQQSPKPHILFQPSFDMLNAFVRACQQFVFDTIFLPIVNHLSSILSMDVWNSSPETVQRSPFNLEIPTFSLSPSEYITRVGEHLLTLPQQFEVYADDKSLAFSLDSLPYHDDNPLNERDELFTPKTAVTQASKPNEEEQNESITVDKITTSEAITHAWITSVARGTMFALVDKIFSIPQLSAHGTRQLLTDLGYLTNVLSALDISVLNEIILISKVLEMNEDQLVLFISQKNEGNSDYNDNNQPIFQLKERKVMIKVAGLRGFQRLDFGGN
ncbi:hypothetical protein G9A89_016743 [Geosiphon pyriformis]|nr:hypothetical protein G9A89_016743 [Geosiphon pyriformis]